MGVVLKTEEFKKAFQRIWFNIFVQVFNFGVVSGLVYSFSRFMIEMGLLLQTLGDGMVASTCVPMTVNMVFILTKTSGGDEAAAVFNAAFGNMVGVFLSPVLILGYLGVTGDVDIATVFYKLALRVILPLVIGQIIQKSFRTLVGDFVKKNARAIKKVQQYTIFFIVYTVFCRTFRDDLGTTFGDIASMIGFELLLLCSMKLLAWYSLRIFFRDQPTIRVMGLFGCTHKTVALGVPLIQAIYEENPNVGLYTLPLLIWHPMQLLLGSFLVPRLAKFVEKEQERLGVKHGSSEIEDTSNAEPEANLQPSGVRDGDESLG